VARLNGVYAFSYNSAGGETIWMKFGHCEYIVCHWPWQILGAISTEARSRERVEILFFFLSGKQRAISTTSGQPNFTTFVHNMWICVAMNPFGTNF